jgi:hypothetical protein
LGATTATGATDVSIPTSEADAPGLTITATTRGTRALILFAAPLSSTSESTETVTTKLVVDGTPRMTARGPSLHATYDPLEVLSLQWLETGLTPGSHTFKVRWAASGSGVNQNGATDGPRVLTVLDLE